MHWREKWKAISARIEGVSVAGEFFLLSAGRNSSDPFGVVGNAILPQLRQITADLENLRDDYADKIPFMAHNTLVDFLKRQWVDKPDAFLKPLAAFQSFRAGFEYYLTDHEAEIRSLTELAFEHLRRLIHVSQSVKENWGKAFADGETRCEKEGAVHLLQHGIWAFKASGPGGETDLVYQEPLKGHLGMVERSAKGLVLTEWKKVISKTDLEAKAAQARAQMVQYRGGVLGGVELVDTRYVILVCSKEFPPLADFTDDRAIYRHIQIPINPSQASKAGRETAQR